MVEYQVEISVGRNPPGMFGRNHFPDPDSALILYGENSSGEHSQLVRGDHEGLDVYIRNKPFNG